MSYTNNLTNFKVKIFFFSADINEPTEDNCEEDTVKITALYAAGGVIAALVLLIAASVITFGCYKCCARAVRGKVQINMTDGRYEDASRRINELKEEIKKVITDTTIDSRQRKELREFLEKNLSHWQAVIRGDGADTPV